LRQPFNNEFSVITFATNKLSYVRFALNCAQSVLLYNDIRVYIVSNLNFKIPAHLKQNVFIISANDQHALSGIGMKLYIDQYIQTKQNLFIDADCLCYGSLEPIFKACEGKNVSVVGTIVNASEWCGTEQAKVIEKEFGINQLVRFNGGLYFIEKTKKTTQVFDFARSIFPHYDHYGFQRINNKWINEEGLISISMIKFNETPIADDGRYMTDLYTDPHPARLNVLNGTRELNNPPEGKPKHRPWYPKGKYSPIVLHFGGQKIHSFPYITQYALLKLSANKISINLSTWISKLTLTVPYQVATGLLNFLRKLKINATK
jgi:hypothetical protein